MNNQVERELREALRRREAPPDFVTTVLSQVSRPEARRPYRAWLAVAAMLLVMAAGVVAVRELRQQSEGKRAKEELMVGLRITGSKLRDVRERLIAIQQRSTQPQPEQ